MQDARQLQTFRRRAVTLPALLHHDTPSRTALASLPVVVVPMESPLAILREDGSDSAWSPKHWQSARAMANLKGSCDLYWNVAKATTGNCLSSEAQEMPSTMCKVTAVGYLSARSTGSVLRYRGSSPVIL